LYRKGLICTGKIAHGVRAKNKNPFFPRGKKEKPALQLTGGHLYRKGLICTGNLLRHELLR
jgi:hypothetical protein